MSQELSILEPVSPSVAAAGRSDATSITVFKDIIFGSAAGIIGKMFEYPFDTVKVRLHSQRDDQPLRYRGPLDCFQQSLKHDGIRGLYRGIYIPLVGAAAENSALFFSYNLAQTLVKRIVYTELQKGEDLPLGALVFCGAVSGAFASFILTPIELVKCKMQVQGIQLQGPALAPPGAAPTSLGTAGMHTISPAKLAGPRTLLNEIYRTHGVKGLWHGQIGTLLRETGGSAAWFGAYEYMSTTFRQLRGKTSNTAGEMMVAGAAAGVSYNFILFPADAVKSRMQTGPIGIRGAEVKGFWQVATGMYKAGGIQSLYRGCGLTCARSAPSSAIIFLVYETMKSQFS